MNRAATDSSVAASAPSPPPTAAAERDAAVARVVVGIRDDASMRTAVASVIDDPHATALDFHIAGSVLVEWQEYERAAAALERAAALEPTPGTLYDLARAYRAGDRWFLFGHERQSDVREVLTRVTGMPGCPPGAYLALEHVIHGQEMERGGADGDVGARVEILRAGLGAHPDNAALRARLAVVIKRWAHDTAAALDTLATMNPGCAAAAYTRWQVAELYRECGAPATALAWLDSLGPDDANPLDLALARAELLLDAGRPGDALDALAPLAAADTPDHPAFGRYTVLAGFVRAAALHALERPGAALFTAGEAVDLWFAQPSLEDPSYPLFDPVGGGTAMFECTSVRRVCEALVAGNGKAAVRGGPTLGKLSWLLFTISGESYGSDDDGGPNAAFALAQTALRLAPDRRYFRPMSDAAAAAGQVAFALVYALHARLIAAEHPGEDATPGFDAPGFRLPWNITADTVSGMDDAARVTLDREVAALVTRYRARDFAREVFRRFYTEVWKPLHRNANRWREAEAAAAAMLKIAPDDDALWFDLGFARYEQRRLAEAEAAYRKAITIREDAPVLNNLALICEDTGRVDEATALLARAVALDPANERRVARHRRLLAETEERQRRDDFERSAPERWTKVTGPARSLLATLTLVSRFSGFDDLGRLAGMDATWAERHYRKLVELGMVIESDGGDTFRVNDHVRPLVERERSHSVATTLIRADAGIACDALGRGGAPHHHESIGVLERQRLEQHNVDDGEDGRVGADAERERQERHDRKGRATA